jgi:ABC-type nitrate/sulfonate/bicarbonate transport system permease component
MSARAAARSASRRSLLISCLSVVVGLCIWQLIAMQVSGLILPSVSAVALRVIQPGFAASLLWALIRALGALVVGFAISLAVAIPLGIAMGRSRTLARMFEPVITGLYAIPPVAFVPFLVIWFGLFFEARVALIVLMTLFDMLLVITAGARDVRTGLVDVGRSFGASNLARLRLIVFPALSPFLFAALRVGFARAVNGMITAELFFAAVNLGGLMKDAADDFDTAGALLVVLVVCVLGLWGQSLLNLLEKRMLHWHVRH